MKKRIAVVVVVSVLAIVVCGCEFLQNFMPTLLPVAVISIQKTRLQPNEPVLVSADGSSGNGLVQFIWNFGDGSSDVTLSHSHTPPHSYQSGGTYTITLVVKDDWGRSNPDTVSVTVNYHPVPAAYPQEFINPPTGQGFYRIPDGKMVYPSSVIETQGIVPVVPAPVYTYWKLDSSSSSDSDGSIVSQHFNWAGRNIGNQEVLWLALPTNGSTYTVELIVIDNEGLENSIRYHIASPLG